MNEQPAADISAAEVAAELIRFVERILVSLEVTLADALADERLKMSEVRLLMALERHDYGAAEILAHSDHAAQDLSGRLRGLIARGLIEPASRDSHGRPELTLVGRQVLARLDRASRAVLTQLISGLDGPQRLRLQGAMHLVSDHFGLDALRATQAPAL
jgi:DNA-binding MarR family transcriptional regulator